MPGNGRGVPVPVELKPDTATQLVRGWNQLDGYEQAMGSPSGSGQLWTWMQDQVGNFIFRRALTSRVELKDLVADAADLRVKGHGFTRVGRNFIREDELVRGLRFRTGVSGSFEILFDLGITGISQIDPKTDKWTVGGSASQLRPIEIPARAWMRLTEGAYDEEVRKAVHHVCEWIAVDFLLKYRSGEEFFRWVTARLPKSFAGLIRPFAPLSRSMIAIC